MSGEGPTPGSPGSPEPPDVDRPSGDETGEVTRPAVPIEEMGGDPACWLGLVEDHRDDGLPAEPPP